MAKKKKRISKKYASIAIFLILFISFLYFIAPKFFASEYELGGNVSGNVSDAIDKKVPVIEPPKDAVAHVKTPAQVKAIYMTSCVAGTLNFRKDLVDLIETTELNSIIIDIKDYTGTLSFIPSNPALKDFLSTRCYAPDMKEFIATLHEKGIYVIGRITVFQDPFLANLRPELAVKKASDKSAIWKDFKGISFVDAGAKGGWDHAVVIAKESYSIGFDELNFDYIRFPSDGNMKDIYFPHSNGRAKADVLEEFFKYLHDNLKDTGAVLSADLFGMTTTNTDDLNIGQQLEKAFPYFDYIAPMVYPSHYPPNFNGYANPNHYPYEIIHFSMGRAVERAKATTTPIKTIGSIAVSTTTPIMYSKDVYDINKLRPWIQDFDYGGNYGPAEVRAQIKAVYDVGLHSWMLWAPSNRYTKEALNP